MRQKKNQNKRKTRTTSIIKIIKRKSHALANWGFARLEEPTNIFPRRFARSMAKAKMRRAGMRHVNKMFSYYWRDVLAR